jgi:hypothetical protein
VLDDQYPLLSLTSLIVMISQPAGQGTQKPPRQKPVMFSVHGINGKDHIQSSLDKPGKLHATYACCMQPMHAVGDVSVVLRDPLLIFPQSPSSSTGGTTSEEVSTSKRPSSKRQ